MFQGRERNGENGRSRNTENNRFRNTECFTKHSAEENEYEFNVNKESLSREMVFLCIGAEDMRRLDTEIAISMAFRGLKYFTVGNERVIRGLKGFCGERVFCSCGERYCWHIFKLVLSGGIPIIK